MSNASFFFGTICPILGTVISTLQHSLGILVIRICRRNGSLGVANPVPWSVSLVCCITWVVYGVMIRDFYVMAACTAGVAVNIFLVSTSFNLIGLSADPRMHYLQVFMEGILIVSAIIWLILAYLIASFDSDTTVPLVGLWGTIIVIGIYVSPLVKVVDIIRIQDASSLNTTQLIVNTLSSTLWLIYGMYARDIYLTISCGVGALFLRLPSVS